MSVLVPLPAGGGRMAHAQGRRAAAGCCAGRHQPPGGGFLRRPSQGEFMCQVPVCAARLTHVTETLMCPQPPSLCVARENPCAVRLGLATPLPRLCRALRRAASNSSCVLPVLLSVSSWGDGVRRAHSSIRRELPLMAISTSASSSTSRACAVLTSLSVLQLLTRTPLPYCRVL